MIVKKRTILVFFVVFLLIFTHFLCYFNVSGYKTTIKNIFSGVINAFNPDDIVSEEDNNFFFVFNINEYINLGSQKPLLTMPSDEEVVIENGVVTFKIKENLTIKSAGAGIVRDVGILENGLKYIEIRHSGNIVTRYENLKIVGVGINFNVRKISIVGTCEAETDFIFKIYKNNKLIEEIEIENGEITWQD